MKTPHLTFITCLISLTCLAQTFVNGSFEYNIIGLNKVEIKEAKSGGFDMQTIPSTVDNEGVMYMVTGIADEAFLKVFSLAHAMELPSTIEYIGQKAFANNRFHEFGLGLRQLTLKGNTPAIIEDDSFFDRSLIEVIVPLGTLEEYISAGWTGFKSIGEIHTEGDFQYVLFPSSTQNTAQVLTTTQTGNITIPTSVIHNGVTYLVTSIGSFTFSQKGLTTIQIPDQITSIGYKAFFRNELETLVIGNNVTTIDIAAFANNKLISVILGDALTSIEKGAFSSNMLSSIDIGDNVKLIDDSAFSVNQLTSVTLGKNVEFIGDNAFTSNQLSNITIGDKVTFIGEGAFSGNRLTTASIGRNVEFIGVRAFYENMLANIVLPPKLTTIERNTFSNNKLTEIVLPSNLTSIDVEAFSGNEITSITFSDQLKSIGRKAFIDNKIEALVIPNSVTNIGAAAFASNKLTSLKLPENLEVISGGAFENNLLESITIPENVKTVGDDAFFRNKLETIYFEGSTPKILEFESFTDTSSKLSRVVSEMDAPLNLAVDVFSRSDISNIDLIIPIGTTQAYADFGWTGFKSITEDAFLNLEPLTTLEEEIGLYIENDKLNITLPNSLTFKNYQLYALTGARVATGKSNEVPLTSLIGGIYIIELNFEETTFRKKFIYL